MDKKVKTITSMYLVKVNNEIVVSLPTLKGANSYIKTLSINDDTNTVIIIKQSLIERVISTFETKTTKVLISSDLDSDLTFI